MVLSKIYSILISRLFAPIQLLSVVSAFAAQESPQTFTYQGRIFNAAGTTALTEAFTFKFQIYNPAANCLLYQETQTYDTTSTDGVFSVSIGASIADPGAKRTGGTDPGLSMATIFQNTSQIRAALSANCLGGYTPTAGDARILRVTVTPTLSGVADVLSPDQTVNSVPQAYVAETLQGYYPSSFVPTDATYITSANLDALFGRSGSVVNASTLHKHDDLYAKLSSVSSQDLGTGGIVTAGLVSVGTATAIANTTLTVKTLSNSDAGIVVRAKNAGQTASLQEWQDNAGTPLASISASGAFSAASFTSTGAINKVTITPPATGATLTLADGKTFTVNNTLTLSGTDATTMTFPTTSATLARTDAANTFTGASTASAWVLTSPTITTSIIPTANDGAPLGNTSNQFSDLFLAEGGVINWDSGDATLTQTGNTVALSGADLEVPDEAYGSTWNGSLNVPTKNAVYDKIEAIGTEVISATLSGTQTNYSIVGVSPSANTTTLFKVAFTSASFVFQSIDTTSWGNGKRLIIYNNTSASAASARMIIVENNNGASGTKFRYPLNGIPIILTPGSYAEFIYNSTDGKLDFLNSPVFSTKASTSFDAYNDYLGSVLGETGSTNTGTALLQSLVTTLAFTGTLKPLGVMGHDPGTTAVGIQHNGSPAEGLQGGQGAALYLTRYTPTTALSDAADRYILAAGFHDGVVAAIVDGVYWKYADTESTTWRTATMSNSAETANDVAGLTVSITAFPWLGIFCNGDWTNIEYFYSSDGINWVMSNVHTTNIPTGTARAFSWGIAIRKTVGTNRRAAAIDLQGMKYMMTRGF